jgi:hypothetical protein
MVKFTFTNQRQTTLKQVELPEPATYKRSQLLVKRHRLLIERQIISRISYFSNAKGALL